MLALRRYPLTIGNPSLNRDLTVCIIDDDETVRDSTRTLLESARFKVRDFGSAAAFLATFDSERVGCLILDIHMPGMSGLQLLDIIRLRGNMIPVVLFTARVDEQLEKYARQAKVVTLLQKPTDGEELIRLVAQVMGLAEVH